MKNLKEYVMGFVFDQDATNVVMLIKDKPEYLVGVCNGLGGKVEDGESPADAMVRECAEESGLIIESWNHIGTIHQYTHDGWTIHFFWTMSKFAHLAKTMETEEVFLAKCDSNLKRNYTINSHVLWFLEQSFISAKGEI